MPVPAKRFMMHDDGRMVLMVYWICNKLSSEELSVVVMLANTRFGRQPASKFPEDLWKKSVTLYAGSLKR